MAPIFVHEDIESLIRHFPPLSLRHGRPALVRSHSGNELVDFTSALSRFESVLVQEKSRIEISHVTSLLGIEKDAEQHILDQCSVQLYFSKDGRSLVPVPVADSIHNDLNDLARISFVDLGAFAARQDIALGSIERWIKFDSDVEWQTFTIDDRRFLCHQALKNKIETRIRQAINAAGSDVCNISASFDDEVQTPILQSLVHLATEGQGGDVILDGAHVVYVPREYSTAAEERYRQSQLDRAHLIATELEDNRYSMVQLPSNTKDAPANVSTLDLDGLEEAVRAKFEEWHPEGIQLRTVTILPEAGGQSRKPTHGQHNRLLVDAGVLHHELGRLKAAAVALVEDDWSKDGNYTDAATIIQNLRRTTVSPRPGLTQLLVRSECVTELQKAASERIDELQQRDNAEFVQLLEANLLVPFQLYATGINSITDATLRQHLEEFVYDDFRRNVIPQAVKAAQDRRLLREKSSHREVEKLSQATVDAKTFAALQASVVKFTKKMKINATSNEVANTVRVRTLQQKMKSMRQMTRGSDVLQNLIWVLLAQKSGGLFMSSGKDTSRMIKQYEAVGDAEMAKRLVQWRNTLKAGEESKEDLQMMREAARMAVEELAAAEQ